MRRVFRDIREPRNWARPWRDPPGMVYCDCCGAASTCVNCATIQLHDDFSSVLGGYTDTTCGTMTSHTWSTSGGALTVNCVNHTAGSSPTYARAITIPALNGLCIAICANLYVSSGPSSLTAGFNIPPFATTFYRNGFNNFGLWTGNTATDANGCVTGTGTFTSGGTAMTDGDTITLALIDTSSGAGTYKVVVYKNGTAQITKTGVALTITAGGSSQVGFNGSPGNNANTFGGQWKQAYFSTS